MGHFVITVRCFIIDIGHSPVVGFTREKKNQTATGIRADRSCRYILSALVGLFFCG